MSSVAGRVRHLDAQVDQISLVPLTLADEGESDSEETILARPCPSEAVSKVDALSSPRVQELLRISKSLSTTSSSRSLLSPQKICRLLQQSRIADGPGAVTTRDRSGKQHFEREIEWYVVGKATIQTYGVILSTLLDQIIPLSDDIWYWEEVLASYSYSTLYTIQTSPIRAWTWTEGIYVSSRTRLRQLRMASAGGVDARSLGNSVLQRWRRFYSIVRVSIEERTIGDLPRRVLSPVALCRGQARQKCVQLRRLREMIASALGVIIGEGLDFEVSDEAAKSEMAEKSHEWKDVLERSVSLMDMVLRGVLTLDTPTAEFEEQVFASVSTDPELSVNMEDVNEPERPAVLARRLMELLDLALPQHVAATKRLVVENGRPSPLIRYWLPAGLLLISSSTILRLLVNHRSDILNWVADLGTTMRDFWFNWVIEPAKRIIGTIRHDSNSEIAIMSRESLKADRDSLERMVVDFALDNPHLATGSSSLNDAQISEVRAKVKEGDVTPVLKAYEKDLRRPFVGAVKGDLVRALLIQVQKTKVDLEVAISGIDALLKSQELVFGFVGLTPGILVLVATVRYLRTLRGGRKGLRRSQRAERIVRVLRKIDRILMEAGAVENKLLSYQHHGLLLCEVHVLRELAHGLLPKDVEKEFIQDLDDVVNLKGTHVQHMALERIRWAYSRWWS
ncbi:hypothetical protein VTK73DRAFT_8045 [Phialemonium thermophilum]|uniref:ATP synthase regulation protein NCA2 n=1 Tax=Phialemonium thermophilum TaxID=223376 RepID=A0ABR3WB22_9PEZI